MGLSQVQSLSGVWICILRNEVNNTSLRLKSIVSSNVLSIWGEFGLKAVGSTALSNLGSGLKAVSYFYRVAVGWFVCTKTWRLIRCAWDRGTGSIFCDSSESADWSLSIWYFKSLAALRFFTLNSYFSSHRICRWSRIKFATSNCLSIFASPLSIYLRVLVLEQENPSCSLKFEGILKTSLIKWVAREYEDAN